MKNTLYGTVYFIGAGPGDPELLTLKAARILATADVVITDRLVSETILSEFVHENALIIPVGKEGGSNASSMQIEINDLIVQYAAEYENIVRLKGGDIAFYSNILDELITVNKYNIRYELVPGITAVSGASAYTGVPLTARNLATGVRILTNYKDATIADDAYKELASFNETLVFYMTGKVLPRLVRKLLQAGAEPSIPFLVVEQATTPNQFVHEFTLEGFGSHEFCSDFMSPSLVIMGKVTSLFRQFAWFPNSKHRIPYFKPLEDNPSLIELINNLQSQYVSRV